MIYLVSYPHSGNTWFRYCVEYITGLPTHGHQKFSICERLSGSFVDTSAEPIMMKRHNLSDVSFDKDDVFLLLLRDPRDCIKKSQKIETCFLEYYSLIESFEKFDGKKRDFYYNYLFETSFVRALDFMLKYFGIKCNIHRICDLKDNLELHRNRCLFIYKNETNKPGIGKKLDELIPDVYLKNKYIIASQYIQ